MKIETVPVEKLILDPANARKHPERNMETIRGSLARFNQQIPILIDKNNVVIAGNARLEAARALGWTHVKCVVSDLEGPERTAFGITDNRTSELAEWDDDVLKASLESLADFDPELLGAAGFSEDELAAMGAGDFAEVAEDEVPDNAPTRCKPGDLWLLGNHRLLCGDSTKAEDVARLMGGEKADMVCTDPPYGVEYEGKTKDALTIKNDGASDLPRLLDEALGEALGATKDGGCWYVSAPPGPIHHVFATWLHARGVWRQTLNWVKNTMVLGHSDYHYSHEPIFYGWKPGAPHRPPPTRDQTTCWEFDKPPANREHPTMKPVGLFAKAIGNSSVPGELVYDPFLGSGTTIIAAEQLSRRCFGMEIDPKYCDVILARWEKLTGREATLQSCATAPNPVA